MCSKKEHLFWKLEPQTRNFERENYFDSCGKFDITLYIEGVILFPSLFLNNKGKKWGRKEGNMRFFATSDCFLLIVVTFCHFGTICFATLTIFRVFSQHLSLSNKFYHLKLIFIATIRRFLHLYCFSCTVIFQKFGSLRLGKIAKSTFWDLNPNCKII